MYKRCSICNKRIKYTEKCICSKRNSQNNYKNDAEKKFYSSKKWQNIVKISKEKYNYLDIYSYYKMGIIEQGKVVHHIEPLLENWDKRLDINNLIFLTEKNHRIIHNLMKKSSKDKENVQNELKEMIKKFNTDFQKEKG